MRRLGQLAMVAIALTFAACTPGAVKPTGAVTGLADACVGIIRVGGACTCDGAALLRADGRRIEDNQVGLPCTGLV